jgi:transcriptional regulator GlxA family with amidase domain
MRVGVAVVDGCFTAAVAAIVDVLTVAEAVRPSVDPAIPPVEVAMLGSRRRVTTGAGWTIPTTGSLADLPGVDVAVVPAMGTMTGDDTLAALDRTPVRRLVRALGLADGPRRVAAACTGTFAAAEAGILDHGRATTSWWLGAAFRRRYPAVDLDLAAMVVTDGRATTAGAAFAHVDLALALLRQSSPELAEQVARLLVIDERPSQGAYLAVDHLDHRDEVVIAFERHVRSHLGEPFDVASTARAVGTSRRTLERRLDRAVGLSPLAFVQRLRVERAVHLMRTTGASADQVAPQVGYANGSTLRALLRRLV